MAKLRSIRNAAVAGANVARAAVTGKQLTVDEKTLALRNAICNVCDYNDNGTCTICTCNLSLKNGLATERCPRGNWPNVTPVAQKMATGFDILKHEIELLELLIGKENAKLPAMFSHFHTNVNLAECTSCAKRQWAAKLEVALEHDRHLIDLKELRSIFYPSTHLKLGRKAMSLLPTN